MRGTRLAGVSPSPMPACGFAPVLAPRCSAPRFLRVSRATAAYIRGPGLPFPLRVGGGRTAAGSKGKSPRPTHKLPSLRVWAPQQGTPVSWRGCILGSHAKFRGWIGCVRPGLGVFFFCRLVEVVLEIAPNLMPLKPGAH